KFRCANAGHNPPLIRRKGEGYAALRTRPNFILAGMEGIQYKKFELQLQPGDEIFLYTDGVTEAQNPNRELFGEKRLIESLDGQEGLPLEEILHHVKADVDAFSGEAEQFDDITMLCVRFYGTEHEGETDASLRIEPTMENQPKVVEFLDEQLTKLAVPVKTARRLKVALDEVFSNIVRYSNATGAEVVCGKKENILTLTFRDNGKPYNPMEAEEPDITASAEDRAIGGLGIFMVRKMMDSVVYEHREGQNVLTLTMRIESEKGL
ncbi:MAG: SpoIIE family protein phosphatase, partial [Anaerotignum sp.]